MVMNAPVICPACGQLRDRVYDAAVIPARTRAAIQQAHPGWPADAPACAVCQAEGKERVLTEQVAAQRGLDSAERGVLGSIRHTTLLSDNTDHDATRDAALAERVAMQVAAVVGSWYFPLAITLFLLLWLWLSAVHRRYEPYPMIVFGVISAVLSALAALHGPFLMMNQRAQQHRDRLRAENDYRVNLKAELEIAYLTLQVSQLLENQADLLRQLQQLSPPPDTP